MTFREAMRELEKRPFLRKRDYRAVMFRMTDKEYRIGYRVGRMPLVEIYVKYPGRKNFCLWGGYYVEDSNVLKALKECPQKIGWIQLQDKYNGWGE